MTHGALYDTTPARGVRVTAQRGHVGDRQYMLSENEARQVAQALTIAANRADEAGAA